MTFILGIKCSDGVVLCSDSEERDGFVKGEVNKLHSHCVNGEWGLAIGCAGEGGVIRNHWMKLEKVLGRDNYDHSKIEQRVESSLMQVAKHYTDGQFQALIAMFGMRGGMAETFLYRSEGGLLSPQAEYCCVGQDATLANFILESIFDGLFKIEQAIRLGVLVTALMKKHADGVSGPTRVVAYRPGTWSWRTYDQMEIAAMEDELKIGEFYWALNRQWMLSNPDEYKFMKDGN
jgi:20S proteasome alpha/beta subunit